MSVCACVRACACVWGKGGGGEGGGVCAGSTLPSVYGGHYYVDHVSARAEEEVVVREASRANGAQGCTKLVQCQELEQCRHC